MTPAAQPAARRAAVEHAVFGFVPLLLTVWLIAHVFSDGLAAVDFRQAFYAAGQRVLHGGDPYAWTHHQIAAGVSFPYPALTGVLFAPLALLAEGTSAAIFTGLCLAATLVALILLGVRDWRLAGVVLVWSPVVIGWQTANVSLLLLLGLSLTWRHRDRPVWTGLIVALMVSVKPIVLPLGLWLLVTRRYAAAAYALVWGLLLNLVAWTVVGWGGISHWLRLVSTQGDILYRKGYGVIAVAADFGLARQAGTAIEVVLALGLAGLCVQLGRGHHPVAPFAAAVLLMLVISPQVDSHYFVLLIAPLALVHRRLHPIWVLPLVLWLCPAAEATGWQAVLWWLTALVLMGEIWRRTRPGWPSPQRAHVGGELPRAPVGATQATASLASLVTPKEATPC
jgi:hypothetical protein